jgi:uncharacterized SAM-binding protein YcdF (DUF218 family)
MTISERERFNALVYTSIIGKADAIVVLCGEDAAARLTTGIGLMQSHAAPCIVLSGGKHLAPRWLGAAHLASEVLAMGAAPDRVIVEGASMNTREQAVNVLEIAAVNHWRRILLVASAYHLPRAFLTFLKAAMDREHEEVLQILPIASGVPAWFEKPPGTSHTRLSLLESELRKIDRYTQEGHCASYAAGVHYFRFLSGH